MGDDRRASRRRAYDALIALVKGTPLEATVARYAAEMGYTPEDAVWESVGPMMLAAQAIRVSLDEQTRSLTLTDTVRKATIAAIGEVGEAPMVAAIADKAAGAAVAPVIQNQVAEIVADAKTTVAEYRAAFRWWHPVTAASLAVAVVAAGIVADTRYVHDTAYTAGYYAGTSATLRAHHLSK
jgi:hypothetical protein